MCILTYLEPSFYFSTSNFISSSDVINTRIKSYGVLMVFSFTLVIMSPISMDPRNGLFADILTTTIPSLSINEVAEIPNYKREDFFILAKMLLRSFQQIIRRKPRSQSLPI